MLCGKNFCEAIRKKCIFLYFQILRQATDGKEKGIIHSARSYTVCGRDPDEHYRALSAAGHSGIGSRNTNIHAALRQGKRKEKPTARGNPLVGNESDNKRQGPSSHHKSRFHTKGEDADLLH